MAERAQVVIIGAGITGCSIAYFLAKQGCTDVIVIDKRGIAAGATGICPGGIRQQWGTAVNCRMSKFSTQFYERINDELEPEYPIEFRQVGYVFLAHTAASTERLEKNVALQQQFGIPSRMLQPSAVADIIPDVNPAIFTSASFCATDGFVDDAYHVTNSFAHAAKRRGVRFQVAEVEEIIMHGQQVAGVMTSKGRVDADIVVNASGTQSVALAENIGVHLPITPEIRRLMFTNRIEERVLEPLMISLEMGFAAKQLTDGTLYLSYLGSDLQPPYNHYEYQLRVAEVGAAIFPPLERMEMRSFVDGTYDTTPDHQAILGDVDGVDGYYQAVGMSGHGFMMGPAVGLCMAQMVLGETPTLDIHELHIRRFQTEELIPEPSIV